MRLTLLSALLVGTVLLAPAAHAQTAPPVHETRAVWVTTVWRLDWPPFDANVSPTLLRQVQQRAMDRIVEGSAERGFNTLFFQVFFHGTAAYDSERVPWTSLIAGEPGKDPGWDPLEYIIEKAHSHGMEVHAWFNVYQMGNANTEISETAEPLHVRVANPDWITPYYLRNGDIRDYWINPAHPDAREWLVGNVEEIIANYDVDGIHFDYMRYEEMGFEIDQESRATWPNSGSTLAEWRRENVNMFVRDAYAAVKDIKPWVKVGSAPIGMRKYYLNAPPGYWGWDFLYQDAARWMQEGIQDYISPQLYFDIGNNTNPHDFESYLEEWLTHAHGRHVYAGLATYRQNDPNERIYDAGEIARQIEMARDKGAQGQVHFRYRHTEPAPFGGNYDRLAIPPPMAFLDAAAAPAAPQNVEVTRDGSSIDLAWEADGEREGDPLRRFAIFRNIDAAPDTTDSDQLVAVLGPDARRFAETLDLDADSHPYYRVVAQSLLGITTSSAVATTDPSPVSAESPAGDYRVAINKVFPNPAASNLTIGFASDVAARYTLVATDVTGRVVLSIEGDAVAGQNDVSLDVANLASGVYLLQIDVAGHRLTTKFVAAR